MSMFRRPTDDSSESESDAVSSGDRQEENDSRDSTGVHSNAGSEEVVGPDFTATETLSSGESISASFEQDGGAIRNAEHHRNMMLASLLEDFYKSRAVELFSTANPGINYHRESPEVQPLARNLFTQAGQDLTTAGVLPASAVSGSARRARQQYIVGFGNLGLQNLQEGNIVPDVIRQRISNDDSTVAVVKVNRNNVGVDGNFMEQPIQDLALRAKTMNLMGHPASDLQLSTFHPRHSHYQSSFRETRLLGKGGFGRVYQTFNYFDKREYAVKKIPLSPRLSQQYREHGHAELHHVLREVQALARLDHCNVVRYHATWIEEPTALDNRKAAVGSSHGLVTKQRLLDNKPASHKEVEHGSRPLQHPDLLSADDGIMFAPDSHASVNVKPETGWSRQPDSIRFEQSSIVNSDIFTDGALRRTSQEMILDDPCCYVLHVQMSMYPLTLTQYLRTNQDAGNTLPKPALRRHCFHLVPSLKIISGILSGLQYVHARGLIHRDIKPSNIFLSMHHQPTVGAIPEGFVDVGSCISCTSSSPFLVNPRIGDFGLVADCAHGENLVSTASSTSSDKIVGTQYYNPPSRVSTGESKLPHSIDEKLDVFALGVILVEMLCQCNTSMQRLELLKGLQSAKIPDEVSKLVCLQWFGSETSRMVNELIHGMIERNSLTRWSCTKVKMQIETILELCETTTNHRGISNAMSDNLISPDHFSSHIEEQYDMRGT